MAGPCTTILIPNRISAPERATVRELIEAVANTVEGDDFWVGGRPMLVSFAEPDEEDATLVLDGWKPRGAVHLCAMSNSQTDHVILGMISHRVAQLLDGRIDLNDLGLVTDDPSVLTYDGQRPVDGRYIVSPQFLAHFLGSDGYRLVK